MKNIEFRSAEMQGMSSILCLFFIIYGTKLFFLFVKEDYCIGEISLKNLFTISNLEEFIISYIETSLLS